MEKAKKAKVVKTTAIAVKEQSHVKETASVETFISQAIAQNLPVETMERLFALREKVKAEQGKEAFIAAMSQFQSECPVIVKDKNVYEKGSTTRIRYKYAPIDSIVNQVRPFLGKNGLSYTVDLLNKDGLLTAICKVTHVLGHSETSSFEVPIDKDSYMSAPQQYAAASTFAKRYAFCNALGIMTGDEDTDASKETVTKEEQAPVKSVFSVAKNMIDRTTDAQVLNDYWKKISGSDKYTAEEKSKLEGIIAGRIEELTSKEKVIEV